jgi:hypothetical protein
MGSVQTLYFPPSGFDFWYYLGQYSRISTMDYNECVGASSGSLLCICTLLDKDQKSNLFEFVKNIALNTLTEYKQQTSFVNLYSLNNIFIDQLFEKIDWTTVDLSKIKIVTTQVEFKYWAVPVLSKRETFPETKEELKELALATTYIPFISNYQYKPYYTIGTEHFIDGGIIDWYMPSAYFSVKPTTASLIMPTEESVFQSYLDGQISELTVTRLPNNPEFYLISPITLTLLVIIFTIIFCK